MTELAARYAEVAVRAAAAAAGEAERAAQFRDAVEGDPGSLEEARSAAWSELSKTFTTIHELGRLWNDLVARTTQTLTEE